MIVRSQRKSKLAISCPLWTVIALPIKPTFTTKQLTGGMGKAIKVYFDLGLFRNKVGIYSCILFNKVTTNIKNNPQ